MYFGNLGFGDFGPYEFDYTTSYPYEERAYHYLLSLSLQRD